jgi:hypothetical protein
MRSNEGLRQDCLATATGVTPKRYDRLRNIPHHGRFRGHPLDPMERCNGGGGDHISPPDQRRGPAAGVDRPHLIERQADVITTTRIVEGISGLKCSIGARTTVGGTEGQHAQVICHEELPKKFRPERTGRASDSRAIEQPGELLANLVLLAKQSVELLGRPDRLSGMIIGRLGRAAAQGKSTSATAQDGGPKAGDGRGHSPALTARRGQFLRLFFTDLQVGRKCLRCADERPNRCIVRCAGETGKACRSWR